MTLKMPILVLSAFLTGCVSNTVLREDTTAAVNSATMAEVKAANHQKSVASAEQIAARLLQGSPLLPEPPLDVTELEDIWQRIQSQLTFQVPQTRPIVEQRNFFTRHQSYLDRVALRAQPFLYFIVEELEARNMPLELALLPIVESAFDPFAYSPARASGMWQFMPATGQRFGLKQNFWYDGRRDVIESTRAALDYLQYLYNTLEHDWLNAIAAYNAGEGRIGRAVRANKNRRLPTDFWSLDLPAETTAYVPKLLALVDMLQRPDDFDIVWKFIANEPRITVVEVHSQIDLALAADMAELSVAELQALNPGFNQWATDPDGPHRLVLPLDKAQHFSQTLAATPAEQRLQWQRYSVAKGDTLGKIAQQHNTSVDAISRLNKLSNNTIRIGQHLLIPVSADNADRYVLSQQNRINAAQQRPVGHAQLDHIVQSGDTLWDISRKYNVTVAELARWNGMVQRDPLRPGQKLVIWQQQEQQTKQAITRTVNYRVRAGDSLARIAQRFSVTVADIVRWNDINIERFLQPGQQLKLIVDVTQV